eukprot:c25333_g3_i2 orf=348-4094(+)
MESVKTTHNKVETVDTPGYGREVGDSPRPTASFFSLFKFATAFDLLLMSMGSVGASVHGASLPVAVYFFGKLVDSIATYILFPKKMYHEGSQLSLYLVYVGIVTLFSAWLEVFCWTYTGERQTTKMRMRYLKALLSQNIGFYDKELTTGEVIVGFSNDTILVQDSIGEKVGNFIHNVARCIVAFCVSFSISWQLALLTLAVVPLIALAGATLAFVMIGLTSGSQKAYLIAGSFVEQAIGQIRTVYAFGGEEKAVKYYVDALQTTAKLGKRGALARGFGVGCVHGMMFLILALLLWHGSHMVQQGAIRGGPAFATIFNAIIGGVALGQAFPAVTVFAKGKSSGYTILEMIRQSSSVQSHEDGEVLAHVEGHLELQHVRFSYPSRPNTVIFDDFSLDIPAGKLVAIVGGSGSGKSTIVSLIERFYEPQAGQVLLDGHNIKKLQLKWFRAQIGLVSQEPALFATTILENISFGKDHASIDEVIHAAKLSGAHVFIDQLPAKYETQVGERGVQLSGGQKQRIAIARAMLKDPVILLLDEATSALDSESEKSVQAALRQVMVGRTTIMVAHRLSTICDADIINVVQEGKILESGQHDELLAGGGAYADLVKLQSDGLKKSINISEAERRLRHSGGSSMAETSFSFRLSVYSDSASRLYEDAPIRKKHSSRTPVRRLVKLNAPEWPYSVLGTLGAIGAGGSLPFLTLGVTQALVAFYSFIQGYMSKEIKRLSLMFCGGALATAVCFILEHYSFGVMSENVTLRIRERMLSAILRNEIGWFEEESNNSAVVASRLASDALLVKAAVADLLCTVMHNGSLVIVSFVIAFVEQWRTALVMFATFPLIVSSAWAQRRFVRGFGGDLSESYLRANRVAGEAVSNIRTVSAFCVQDRVLNLFSRELEEPAEQSFWAGQVAGFFFGFSQCCMFSSYALTLWYGSKLISQGVSSFGSVLKCFTVITMTAFGFAEALLLTPNIMEGLRSVGSVFEVLDRQTQVDPDDPNAEDITQVKGLIQLKHVSFKYPSRPDVSILENLDLRIEEGRSLALVGASGSGKSTVIALILRFYDPVSGKVMVDGKDTKKLKLRSFRKHIALVQQEPTLFSCSIYENILYGRDDASEAEVIAAAKAANAHSFISGLEDGYETEVGERGVQLSGGQKQRVAIARAVLRNPAILLLDEATSALDAESESVVQAALDVLMQGRTTVVVAHRLSTVQNLDTITVLEGGKVKEQGRHAELVKRGGLYARLLHLSALSSST